MCKIIGIKDFVRNKRLKDDYLSEVSFYTNKFISDSQKLHKLRNLHFCPFKNKLIKILESVVSHDKFCISVFTELYSRCSVQFIQIV